MITLIGGAPRCGKSILAAELSKQSQTPWVSTDALQSMIVPYIPKKNLKQLMPFEGKGSEHMTPKQSLHAEIRESQTVWPGIERFIKQLVDMRQDYIIEGVHLLPQYVVALFKTPYGQQIRVAYLIKKDIERITDGFRKNTNPFDWMAGCLDDAKLLQHMAGMVALKGTYVQKQAKKYHLPVYNTEQHFNKTLRDLMRTLK
jgi:2-phosphoglycerate kinase